MPKSVKKCVELFEEGYPEEPTEPLSHVKRGIFTGNTPSYMIEVKRKI